MSEFAQTLARWRRSEGLRQADLAVKLGVSQQAVSYWERGHDVPDAERLQQLRSLMARSDEIALERTFMRDQTTIRALFDIDSMSILGLSKGYAAVWPSMAAVLDVPLHARLVNESAILGNDGQLRRLISNSEVFAARGVSERHFDLPQDPAFLHRWFVRFRKIGTRLVGDMLFEPAETGAKPQIETIYCLDDI